MYKNHKKHCIQCKSEVKVVFRKASVFYRCKECGYRIPSASKICKKHGDAGYSSIKLPETTMTYKCKKCGFKEKSPSSKSATKDRNDPLFRELDYNREIQSLVIQNYNPKALIMKFLQSSRLQKSMDSLHEFLFPNQVLENIVEMTACDKGVEKSHLKNIIL